MHMCLSMMLDYLVKTFNEEVLEAACHLLLQVRGLVTMKKRAGD